MAKTAYNTQLKGHVGGAAFYRKTVDTMLAEQSGKRVNVLIDSLGGSFGSADFRVSGFSWLAAGAGRT